MSTWIPEPHTIEGYAPGMSPAGPSSGVNHYHHGCANHVRRSLHYFDHTVTARKEGGEDMVNFRFRARLGRVTYVMDMLPPEPGAMSLVEGVGDNLMFFSVMRMLDFSVRHSCGAVHLEHIN